MIPIPAVEKKTARTTIRQRLGPWKKCQGMQVFFYLLAYLETYMDHLSKYVGLRHPSPPWNGMTTRLGCNLELFDMRGWAFFVAVTPEENILHMQPKAPHEQGDSSISWGCARTQGFEKWPQGVYLYLFYGNPYNSSLSWWEGSQHPKMLFKTAFFSKARFFCINMCDVLQLLMGHYHSVKCFACFNQLWFSLGRIGEEIITWGRHVFVGC